jgi:hypothetical protein
MTKGLISLLLAAAVALTWMPVARAQEVVPKALIDRIERQMIMPGYRTIVSYIRYYALMDEEGRSYVVVQFRQLRPNGRDFVPEDAVPVNGRPNVYVMPSGQLPLVYDGGCSVVTAVYDIEASRLRPAQSIMNMLGLSEEKQTGWCNGAG